MNKFKIMDFQILVAAWVGQACEVLEEGRLTMALAGHPSSVLGLAGFKPALLNWR